MHRAPEQAVRTPVLEHQGTKSWVTNGNTAGRSCDGAPDSSGARVEGGDRSLYHHPDPGFNAAEGDKWARAAPTSRSTSTT